jgi:uncharacterized integral membrane protein
MSYILWIIKAALFVLVLLFAIVNTDPVTVRFYLGYRWEAPLVVVLLATLTIGALAGVVTTFLHIFQVRRQVARLEQELHVAA